ncbi:MAG TPA: universal stress protein [Pilimelia sp.]|nr:universal stress protein [Pilimelia sp.]
MTYLAGAPVVVGVDGSAAALEAVGFAARDAARRRRALRVVHAFIWPLLRVPIGPSPAGPPTGGLRHQAEEFVAEAVAQARATAPDTPVTGEVVEGAAAPVLLREAGGAALVVLGSRGLGGLSGLLIGSVAVQVTAHATCPVVVARGELRDTGPVVVGVDGSDLSDRAVGFAVESAALRGAELLALHAWTHPVASGPGDILPVAFDLEAFEAEGHRTLAEAVAGWGDRFPEVKIGRRLVRGAAADALIDESADAQLLVVGARGRGGFAGLLMGSVSHKALHHARCPVAVVRG